ncbi:MAG TPA: pyridoxal-dependent decarboxylase [Spirochaetota bacterium]
MRSRPVIADIEHLRKLFIMPDSPDKFMEFGHELLEMIHAFFKDKGGIHSAISLPELGELFSELSIPDQPHLLKDTFAEIKNKVVAHSVKVGNPYYVGHMTSAVPYFSILIEMIIASLNQNQVKIETAKASTFVERELIGWIHRLIYDRDESFYSDHVQNHQIALGNVVLDGTIANLTAIHVALAKAFPPDGRFPGVARAGLIEAYRHYGVDRAIILMSKRGHYSFNKIARICGIGEDNVIKVDVDWRNKLDLYKLAHEWTAIKERNDAGGLKTKVVSLIGIAGTTETGNIDDLDSLEKWARAMSTHFHVDAAWGGPVLFVDTYRHLFKGIERADSVTFDAHKLLFTPNSMGMVLFRNEQDLSHLKHNASYILRPDSWDQGRFTIEGSRPFTSLRAWTSLKVFGSHGFRLLFENAFDLTAELKRLIDTNPSFEAMSDPELFIFNYRYAPLEIREALASCRDAKKRESVNNVISEMNIDLHRAIRKKDTSFVSRTVLESTRYAPERIVVLRTVTINPLTTKEILSEIVEEHERLGAALYTEIYQRRLSQLIEE